MTILSLFLAAWLGFAAHRASLCTVKAVAEVLSTGKAYMFLSFAKIVLWVMAIALPILWLVLAKDVTVQGHAFNSNALLGGFLFGVGAAMNGGCAISTLSHLADGDLWMLASLLGYCTGVAAWVAISGNQTNAIPALPTFALDMPRPAALMLLFLLWLWVGWELWRLWRTRLTGVPWRQLLCAEDYRLSTAAVILGITGGALYTLHGSWTYTTTLEQEVQGLMGFMTRPSILLLGLFLAMFAGMVVSSWQRGSLRLRWQPAGGWLRRLLGGTMMGIGGVAIPGGNDALILKAIPLLSPHALPTFIALAAGIACTLLLLRLLTGTTIRVECAGDVCRSVIVETRKQRS